MAFFHLRQSGQRRDKGRLSRYVEIFWEKEGFSLIYKTNRFHVAVRLFSNRSQKTSKCGKSISDTLGYASCPTFLFLPQFDVICDLLLNRRTATWNLFVNYLRNRKQVFLSSYTNTSGSLGDWEMLWKHEPQASVSTAFSSSFRNINFF